MSAVTDSTVYWAVLARTRGEILTAEAQSPGLHLGLLGVPPGLSPDDAESWLYDIIGVAHEGSPEPEAAGHIPPLLRHALTGLVFSHAELWDRDARRRPCSYAFAHTVHEVGFGWVGEARVRVWVDGTPIEPEWVTVRDEAGREARGWSLSSDHSVQVHIDWRPDGEASETGAEVEAAWTAVRRAIAPGPEPAASAEASRSSEIAKASAEPTDLAPVEPTAASVEPVAADAAMHPAMDESAVARWLRSGFNWLEGRPEEPAVDAEVHASDDAPEPSEEAPLEQPAAGAASPWASLPERIPPTPEPPELTARTVAWNAPPDPRAIELPPSEPTRLRPHDESSDIEFHTVPAQPPHTVERPSVAPAAADPPAVSVAPQWSTGPRTIDLPPAPIVPVSRGTPVVELPPAPIVPVSRETPVVEPPPAPEPPRVIEPAPVVEPPPAPEPPPVVEPPPAPEPPRAVEVTPAESVVPLEPVAATPVVPRRLVFQTNEPEWPTMGKLGRNDLPLWRRWWLWVLLLALLFAGGWGIGTLQDNGGPRDVSHRGPFGAALHALGLGGPRYRLDVSSRPSEAWIAVDGHALSLRTPAAIELAPGEHRLTLSFGDRGGATFTVRGARNERVPLEATLWGSLDVFSPDELGVISVTVDGVPRGTAPLHVDNLAPGVHELRFSAPGVEPWGQTVDIHVGERHEVLARAVSSPANGVLQVRGTVTDEGGAEALRGAQVWVDGEPRGITPLTLDLPRGPHSVRVAYRGQEAPIQVIDLPGGNQRFAVFEFGLDTEVPKIGVDLPPRIGHDRSTVVSAAIQGIAPGDVHAMWLHVWMGDSWRAYEMTMLKSPSGLTGVTLFPQQAFDANGRTRWYVSANYGQGDEVFTELKLIQLDKPTVH